MRVQFSLFAGLLDVYLKKVPRAELRMYETNDKLKRLNLGITARHAPNVFFTRDILLYIFYTRLIQMLSLFHRY